MKALVVYRNLVLKYLDKFPGSYRLDLVLDLHILDLHMTAFN